MRLDTGGSTPRRVAEHLGHREQHVLAAIEGSAEGFVTAAAVRNAAGEVLDFELTDVNGAACRLIGRSREQLIGQRTTAIFPAIGATGLLAAGVQALQTGQPVVLESLFYECRAADGQTRSRYYDARIGRFDDTLVVTFAEVTARVQVAKEVGQRNEDLAQQAEALRRRLQLVVGNAPVILVALDSDGVFTLSEGRALSGIGLKSGEAVGWSALELYGSMPFTSRTGEVLPGAEVIRRVLGGDDLTVVNWANDRCFENHFVPRRNDEGRIVGLIGVATDFTDRWRAEESLRCNEERLRLALCATNDAIWDWDVIEGRMAWNTAYEAQFGRPPEAPHLEPWGRERIHPEDHERVTASLREAIRAAQETWNCEYRCRRVDGTWAAVHDRAYLARDATGRVVRVVGAMQDVTALMQAQEDIRTLNADLERRVQERTAALERANRELEAFSYSVSHDLRAPVRAIEGLSRIVVEDYGDRLDQQARHYLERVRRNTARMSQLIDDLLGLSRVILAELHSQPVDLSALAREIIAELRKTQPQRVVECVIAAGLTVMGDARLLRVALSNLLDNAWKYTAKTAAAYIEVGVHASAAGAPVYFVRDNGAGFDPAYADRLFAPFQRLHSEHEFEGSGIGLATVQRIIHRHGGRIWAEGAIGRGASFYFAFPPA